MSTLQLLYSAQLNLQMKWCKLNQWAVTLKTHFSHVHCPKIVPAFFHLFFPHFTTSPVVKRFTSTRSSKKNRWNTLQTANSNWNHWKAMLCKTWKLCKSLSKICVTSLSLPSMNYNTVSVWALTKQCTGTGASKTWKNLLHATKKTHHNITSVPLLGLPQPWQAGRRTSPTPKPRETADNAWCNDSCDSWHMFEAPAGCAQSSRSVFAPVQGQSGARKRRREKSRSNDQTRQTQECTRNP